MGGVREEGGGVKILAIFHYVAEMWLLLNATEDENLLKKTKKLTVSISIINHKEKFFQPASRTPKFGPSRKPQTLYMTSNKTMLVDEKDENLCFSQMLLKMLI